MRRSAPGSHDSSNLDRASLEQYLSFARLLNAAAIRFTNRPGGRTDAVLEELLRMSAEFFGADGAALILLDAEDARFSVTHFWMDPELQSQTSIDISISRFTYEDAPWLLNELSRGTAVSIPKTADLPEEAITEREFCRAHGIESVLAIPLSPDGALGCVCIASAGHPLDLSAALLDRYPAMGELFSGFMLSLREEDALIESRDRFRRLVQCAPEAILLIDMTSRMFVDCNKTACALLGIDCDALLKLRPEDVSPPLQPDGRPSAETFRAFLKRLATREDEPVFEHTFVHADGREIPCEVRLARMPGEEGMFARASVTGISERKKAEQALQQSEEKMWALLNTLPDPVFIIDQDGRFEYVFALDASLLYHEPSKVLGKTLHELFDSDTAVAFLELVRTTISSGKSQSLRYSLDVPAGKRHFEGRTALLSRQKAGGGKVIWMARDITEQIHADKIAAVRNELNTLADSRLGLDDMLRQILRKAIAVSDMDCGGIYLVNEQFGDLTLMYHTGLSETFTTQLAHEDSESVRIQIVMRGEPVYSRFEDLGMAREQPFADEGLRSVAVIPIRHEGKVIACINVASHTLEIVPVHARTALESIAAYIGIALAVAKAEEENRKQTQRIQSLFRAAPAGIGMVIDRVMHEVNDNLCTMSGYTRHELIGRSARMLYHSQEEFEDVGREYYSQIRIAGSGTTETRWRRKDGTVIDVLISASALDPDNLGEGVTFTVLDITGYKRAQREITGMLEFEKLVSGISAGFVKVKPDLFDEEMNKTMRLLGEFFHADRCAVILESPETRELIPYYVWASDTIRSSHNTIPSVIMERSAEFWKRGESADLSAIRKDASDEILESLRRVGYRSLITVPLKIGDICFGGFGISSFQDELEWPEEFMSRLRLLGEILANSLMHMRAEDSLRRSFSEIQGLRDQLQSENIYLRQTLKDRQKTSDIVGESEALRRILKQVEQVAGTSSTVLLTGETGTGKGMLARAIHDLSPRRDRQLIEVNCATLPATLAESELFGHEKGAFTGAQARKMGRFELAHGSTILLDEVGELSDELQAKLLRVLHEGTFERLGGSKTLHADVRVIAASNRDLTAEVDRGRFRQDLFYRLNVFPIHVPPLRERDEDIPLLAWKFVKEYGPAMGKRIDAIPRKHIEALKRYSWPGNIRELRNVIERAVIVTAANTLELDPMSLSESSRGAGARLEDMERAHIQAILERVGWRVRGKGGAAELLGLKPTTLYSRMQKLGLKKPEQSVDI